MRGVVNEVILPIKFKFRVPPKLFNRDTIIIITSNVCALKLHIAIANVGYT